MASVRRKGKKFIKISLPVIMRCFPIHRNTEKIQFQNELTFPHPHLPEEVTILLLAWQRETLESSASLLMVWQVMRFSLHSLCGTEDH